MALAEVAGVEFGGHRRIGDVYKAGLDAVDKLATAERLRAEAVAQLVEFEAIDGHVASGYLTAQRQLVHGAGLADREANRLLRLVRFCQSHPLIA